MLRKINRSKEYSALKKTALAQGLDLFGVADIRNIRNEFLIAPKVLAKLDNAVCLGARLSEIVLEDIADMPTKLYFYHYKTVNAFLDQATLRVANYIQKKGFYALPIPASQIVDWKTQKAHLSHRKVGQLAGLGWIGRNNLLVNPKLGSQFRLSTILTDMPLKLDKPLLRDCGSCDLCMQLCPAKAISENPLDFDPMKCFDKLKEFQKHRQVDQYVCGICLNSCKSKQ